MNKKIDVQLDKSNFWQVEKFIDQLSAAFELDDTYYGNILTVISELFEYFLAERPGQMFQIIFEAGHDGLVFEVQVKVAPENKQALQLTPDILFLIQTLTDDFKMDMDQLHLTLFFDTKSVFSLMAKNRAQELKNYLKGEEIKAKKHNDSLQGN
jgi:hypothetical protein